MTHSTAVDRHPPPPLPQRSSTSNSRDVKAMQAQTTTALTQLDIQTVSFPDGSRGTFATTGAKPSSSPTGSTYASSNHAQDFSSPGMDDAASIMSYAPTMRPAADIASLLAGELNKRSPAWNLLRSQTVTSRPFEKCKHETHGIGVGNGDHMTKFEHEFEPLPEADEGISDDGRLALWKAKLKHFMILSSAGKPIWSRHGDLSLINSSIGVVQTIISFYEGSKNPLQGFTAGDTRFVICTQGPLYLVAISKLGESDSQLRSQLDALYMQILSTLTLSTLTHIFKNRPSSDLRKPLQGTESLLSSLADTFTKGSASTLLSSLECLRLRKSQRHAINSTFLKLRSEKLLYGLIVAGGKLVSVIRPRRHSLHPSDLRLIFNMLFESDGIKAGGGENWIPLCLPAFNNRGYLHMYVSFFEDDDNSVKESETSAPLPAPLADDQIALVLISADRESFYEMKQMRDNVVAQIIKNGSLATIQEAVRAGRPRISQITPGSQISHFIYKSRANVQFCMGALVPYFTDLVDRRKLMTVYHELHASVHAKQSHLKVLHVAGEDVTSLAWVTQAFEFFCVAGPSITRASMTQGANKIIQWVKREEERIFIIGGGVF